MSVKREGRDWVYLFFIKDAVVGLALGLGLTLILTITLTITLNLTLKQHSLKKDRMPDPAFY